jgi:hypothetical protein
MKWLEIIFLRTAGCLYSSNDQLKDLAGSLSAPGLIESFLYRHASIAGDLALTLHWDTEDPSPQGSNLALGLKQGIKQRGLVDHSVWIPVEKGKRGESGTP